eukprot:978637-Amphidinium_carterae.3
MTTPKSKPAKANTPRTSEIAMGSSGSATMSVHRDDQRVRADYAEFRQRQEHKLQAEADLQADTWSSGGVLII